MTIWAVAALGLRGRDRDLRQLPALRGAWSRTGGSTSTCSCRDRSCCTCWSAACRSAPGATRVFGLLLYAVVVRPTPLELGAFVLVALSAGAIMASYLVLANSLAFWLGQAEGLAESGHECADHVLDLSDDALQRPGAGRAVYGAVRPASSPTCRCGSCATGSRGSSGRCSSRGGALRPADGRGLPGRCDCDATSSGTSSRCAASAAGQSAGRSGLAHGPGRARTARVWPVQLLRRAGRARAAARAGSPAGAAGRRGCRRRPASSGRRRRRSRSDPRDDPARAGVGPDRDDDPRARASPRRSPAAPGARLRVTAPVTTSMSAWRGEATKSIPSRCTS